MTQDKTQFPSLAWVWTVCLTPFTEKSVLCQSYALSIFDENRLSINAWIIFGLCLLFPWSMYLFYASIMLFPFPWLCSIFWSQVLWYLQLCSFFSRLLWLVRVFCGSIWILGMFLKNIFVKIQLNFWFKLHWICRLFLVVWTF
jgi:hypothetical protein